MQTVLFVVIITALCVCIGFMASGLKVKPDKLFIFSAEAYIIGYLLVYPLCNVKILADFISSIYKIMIDIAGVTPPFGLIWLTRENVVIPRNDITVMSMLYMPLIPIFAVHMITMCEEKMKALIVVPAICLVSMLLVMMSLSSMIKLIGWGAFAIVVVSFLGGKMEIKPPVPDGVSHNEYGKRDWYRSIGSYEKFGEQYVTMSNGEHTVDLRLGKDGGLYDKHGERFDN